MGEYTTDFGLGFLKFRHARDLDRELQELANRPAHQEASEEDDSASTGGNHHSTDEGGPTLRSPTEDDEADLLGTMQRQRVPPEIIDKVLETLKSSQFLLSPAEQEFLAGVFTFGRVDPDSLGRALARMRSQLATERRSAEQIRKELQGLRGSKEQRETFTDGIRPSPRPPTPPLSPRPLRPSQERKD